MRTAVALVLLIVSGLTHVVVNGADATGDANGPGQFASLVPDFSLKDATGVTHTSASLYKETGMLLMVTAPNMNQYERQKCWEKMMKREWPENNAPRCVVLEDLSQQQSYKDKARTAMRDKSHVEKRETFLVDENGDVRRSLGVGQDETVVLLVDSSGCVIHNELDDPENCDQAARRVLRQVRKLVETVRVSTVAAAKTLLEAPTK